MIVGHSPCVVDDVSLFEVVSSFGIALSRLVRITLNALANLDIFALNLANNNVVRGYEKVAVIT